MKKIIGILIIVLGLAFIALLILRIWGIEIISIQHLVKSSATLLLLGFAVVALIITYGFFFKNNRQNYNNKAGNRAHPKI